MVIVKLQGGLGNQLFQYSAGLSLSMRLKTQLKVDVGFFENQSLRYFELGKIFDPQIASKKEVEAFYKKGLFANLESIIQPKHVFEERGPGFDKRFLKLDGNIFLIGYFQDLRYFEDIANMVKADLDFKPKLNSEAKRALQMISEPESVSVHIRRGDYVTNPVAKSVLGTLPISFYKNAFDLMHTKLKNPKFFLFTDDVDWVSTNSMYRSQIIKIIDFKNRSDLMDLWLMTKCKHNIIANSSFSWWGAWLNSNESKIVIAPKRWYKNTSMNVKSPVLTDWITI